MTLWALSREQTSEFIAAPSYEAAEAACIWPGDSVKPWFFAPEWHAAELPNFLECVEGVAEQ